MWLGRMSEAKSPSSRRDSDRAAAARMLAAIRQGADVRKRKVRRLRGAVRAAVYENPLKLHVALDKLADDLT
jgi:hypothetical protein